MYAKSSNIMKILLDYNRMINIILTILIEYLSEVHILNFLRKRKFSYSKVETFKDLIIKYSC